MNAVDVGVMDVTIKDNARIKEGGGAEAVILYYLDRTSFLRCSIENWGNVTIRGAAGASNVDFFHCRFVASAAKGDNNVGVGVDKGVPKGVITLHCCDFDASLVPGGTYTAVKGSAA